MKFVTEYLLPAGRVPVLREGNAAELPPWAHPGSFSCGSGINAGGAAVLLWERARRAGREPDRHAAGVPVSPGFVDGASERLNARLEDAGFDAAIQAP